MTQRIYMEVVNAEYDGSFLNIQIRYNGRERYISQRFKSTHNAIHYREKYTLFLRDALLEDRVSLTVAKACQLPPLHVKRAIVFYAYRM